MNIDAILVSELVAVQFPQWRDMPIEPVHPSGWDNRSFRLGDALLVRMPSAVRYAAQVEKEQAWLPKLAPRLPLRIPEVLARGRPGAGYPWPWSVYRWIDGEPASTAAPDDDAAFAAALADFLWALHRIPADDGPPAGEHNFHRGGSLTVYADQMQQALAALPAEVDRGALARLWAEACGSRWAGPALWVHGDIAPGNLLLSRGRLHAVIDFGMLGTGDPACDLAIAWTMLTTRGRDAFRARLRLDQATWTRGRAWAAWKAAILLSGVAAGPAEAVRSAASTLAAVIADQRT